MGGLAVPASATASAQTGGGRAERSAATEGVSASGRTVTKRFRAVVRDLPVARETRAGYDRDLFVHWVDADGDCRDTRDEVLAQESLVAVSGCDVQRGKWRSYYDGVETRDSSDFDIDHTVALAEAWDSGAKRWTADTRERYANDLADRRSLVAVSASSNRSKGDRDPAEWLPERATCRYLRYWAVVKTRWQLRVNQAEKDVLVRRAARCDNLRLSIRVARVEYR
ncbi:HNH endonuclease [Nocardioides guangzhouensis]|uniref:HNH endonuclease n=1 Tax=Nocardioides guangzhouensis TaxID=2497878 RepID=A0A4Q4Z7A4_9ACTN|nr:HNH endonuclease [Nocardioides guangzhouensis]